MIATPIPHFGARAPMLIVIGCALVGMFAKELVAQTAPAGRIEGRILSAATGSYLYRAEVSLSGTDLVVRSESNGYYQFNNVSPGPVTVVATYIGYSGIEKTGLVAAGSTLVLDFELPRVDAAVTPPGSTKEIISLARFVVTDDVEGTAKAQADQRAGLNAKNVVASDSFGPVADGNVGEYIKYLPGVVTDWADTTARGVRLAGLETKYAAVTVDGMALASGASASFGSGTRGVEMDNLASSGVEAVEINKTLTASMDAGAAAGSINLRSKNAFDRKGRRILYQFSAAAETYSMTLRKTAGPGDAEHSIKVRPGLLFDYSDVFLDQRLGVQFAVNAFNSYDEGFYRSVLYDYGNPARGPVIRKLVFRSNLQFFQRATFSLNADYKATPRLVLSLRSSGTYLDDLFTNREMDPGVAIADVSPESTLTRVVTRANGTSTNLTSTGNRFNKYNSTISYSPRFRYQGDSYTLSGSLGYSRSLAHYESIQDGFFDQANIRLTSMSWMATRGSTRDFEWNLTQLSGRPWSDPASYIRDTGFANNIIASPRAGRNQKFSGTLDGSKTLGGRLPIELKAGLKSQLVTYSLYNGGTRQWTYVGPSKIQTSAEALMPMEPYVAFGANLGGNVAQQNWPIPNRVALHEIFRTRPDHFVADEFGNFQRTFLYPRTAQEQIDAGYLMGETRAGRLRLQAGARYEHTRTMGKTFEPIPGALIRAQRPDLVANTIPYVLYQYRNGERATRYGDYNNWFLSGGAKYAIAPKLDAQVSFSEAILRPDYNNIAGAVAINETLRQATLPNAGLKPEDATKYYAGFQHYFRPFAVFSVGGYVLTVRDKQLAGISVPAEQAGAYGADPQYAGYSFLSTVNNPDLSRTTGLEVEYNQRLTFLPGILSGTTVFANLTRVIASRATVGLVPKAVNAGLGYKYKRFEAQLRVNWTAARITSLGTQETVWNAERAALDLTASYALKRGMDLFLSGRNINRAPWAYYSNEPGRGTQLNRFGSQWNLGIKGAL